MKKFILFLALVLILYATQDQWNPNIEIKKKGILYEDEPVVEEQTVIEESTSKKEESVVEEETVFEK